MIDKPGPGNDPLWMQVVNSKGEVLAERNRDGWLSRDADGNLKLRPWQSPSEEAKP